MNTISQWRCPRRAGNLVLSLAVGVLLVNGVAAQERITQANYQQAFKYSADFLRQFTYSTSVSPQFIGKTDQFWYSYRTSKGTNYWRVDPRNAKKEPLFDHVKLAAQLSEQRKKPTDPTALTLTRGAVSEDGTRFLFVADDFQYEYDLKEEKLTKKGPAPAQQNLANLTPEQRREMMERMTDEERQRFFRQRQRQDDQQQDQQQQQQQQQQQDQQQDQQQQQQQDQQRDQQDQQQQRQQDQQRQTQQEQRGGQRPGGPPRAGDYRNFSPDRKYFAYVQKYNLYLAEAGKEAEAVQLTSDGAEDYAFGGAQGGFGQQRNRAGITSTAEARPPAVDPERKTRPNLTWSPDSKAFYVTRSDSRGMKELFLVNSIAEPRPTLEAYRYAMPGENETRKTELYYFDVASKKFARVKPKWKDESYVNVHFAKTGEELRFIRYDRLRRNLEVCSLNVPTGECKCLLVEGFDAAYLEYQPVRYVDESNEMIWWSERTGWAHFYLYDRDGKLKNPITSGQYRASRIVAVDPANRLLYFNANGREDGECVYYQHLYRVRFDGTGLTLLDPGCANHSSTLSPSRQFVVDNWSRVDKAPVSYLRDADGKEIMKLEEADLSRLYEVGWRMPETFTVKAADGVTDLYGNMWKPFDFDPKKQYPIIANVYPGPQTEGVTHTFSVFSTNMQLAQLGFIVIQVGHRGGAPTRSKAYASYGYFNLRDYGLADKKTAIEQLAARHPFIDVKNVGIFGHSGGGFMSAAALLQKPYNEFFKAAVASAGNHDNNIYNDSWAERYHGLKEVPITETAQAQAGANAANRGTGGGTGFGRGTRGGQFNRTQNQTQTQTQTQSQEQKKEEEKKEGESKDKVTGAQKEAEKAKDDKQGDQKKTEERKEEKKDGPGDQQEDEPLFTPRTKFEIKVPTNAELAANLKGHLLLVHGEIDNNVHPANTMRLVDALIKANKRFDMLILPGQRHGFGTATPYFNQRMWDFFAEHLIGDRQTGADVYEKRPNGN